MNNTLEKELAIGFYAPDGTFIKNITLLKSNGVAELVYTDKAGNKPFTWMANVITIGVGTMEGIPVGVSARQEYANKDIVDIPEIVKGIPLSVANDIIVDIHRTTWKRHLRDQQNMCQWCSNPFTEDVDLNKMGYSAKDKDKISELKEEDDFKFATVTLPQGFVFPKVSMLGGKESAYMPLEDVVFDKFVFRLPTLGDAIRNEKNRASDIVFWRHIANDCLIRVTSSATLNDCPQDALKVLGMKLFSEFLDREDLAEIRKVLRDGLPMYDIEYMTQCPSCKQDTPTLVSPSSFFTE